MTLTRTAVLCSLAALLACDAVRKPTGCRSDEGCPAGSRCNSGVCGVAPRPIAAVGPIHTVETYSLVTLDGTASRDPGGGEIIEHRWKVTSTDAPCEAPTATSADAWTRVRFGCPGEFAVSLVVVNDLGLESEALTTTVRALPSLRQSVVSAGPDVTRAHSCTSSLHCATTEPVTLAAELKQTGLSLRWSVEPPVGRALDPKRRVTFLPDATSPSPEVVIETDAAAISGDWIFRVEARDEYGVVGASYSRVSVANRPPVLAVTAPAPAPHAFDPARSVFTATGTVAFTIEDPDGDPVDVRGTWRHVGDGGSRFDGKLEPCRATFTVEVPYATREDALALVGGDDLERTIELVARDANGAEARASLPIVIGNRPPQLQTPPTKLSVPHRFDAATQQYVATAELGRWTDPDGDPLEIAGGVAPCAELSLVEGMVTATCSAPYSGTPAVEQLVGRRPVPVRVRDPWSDAATAASYLLNIENSPPTITRTTDLARLPQSRTYHPNLDLCRWTITLPATTFTATPTVSDPDGDPVLIQARQTNGGSANPPVQLSTGGAGLPVLFHQPTQQLGCLSSTTYALYISPSRFVASDGAAAVSIGAAPPF